MSDMLGGAEVALSLEGTLSIGLELVSTSCRGKEATLLIATVLRKGEGFSKCRSGRASVIQLYNSELRTNYRQCKICDARTSTR